MTVKRHPPLTRERVLHARQLYAGGAAVAHILRQCEISLSTLYRCLQGGAIAQGNAPLEPIPRRRIVLRARRVVQGQASSLASRILTTAESLLRGIDRRLARRTPTPLESERELRMLTNIARVVHDLRCFDSPSGNEASPSAPDA